MPELPEVETIKNDLVHTVVGEAITDFSSTSSNQIIPSLSLVKKTIVALKIIGAERRAKLLLLVLRGDKYLAIHLKMTGRVLLRKKGDPQDLYTRAVITLKNKELRFCDVRKFGYIRLFKNEEELKKVVENKLGPEPFSKKFTVSYLEKVLSRKNVAIKTVLMDQTIISGIGNIYANEALFLAGIRPERKAKDLKKAEIKKLVNNIKSVLKKGIKYRGSSSRDESYRDLFGSLGQYQKHFLVYERKGKPCHKCKSVIEYQKLNGRGTFFCPKCQK